MFWKIIAWACLLGFGAAAWGALQYKQERDAAWVENGRCNLGLVALGHSNDSLIKETDSFKRILRVIGYVPFGLSDTATTIYLGHSVSQ